ncbi:MAG TPA: tetratricopeptide repeat protein [Blastocatellia bacterium]|nr:tetratricopeptide repeat protein [Blastocatellia bacterium]
MFKNVAKRACGFVAVLGFLSVTVFAQAGLSQIDGTIKLKNADGTVTAVAGATVDIYRTDIKGHWDVKTEKNGHYIRIGLPYVGVFIIVVSGPGLQPQWLNGVRLSAQTTYDMTVVPGDGRKLTYEELMADIKKSGQPAQPGAGGLSQGDKAKAEAAQKAQQEQESKNKELQAGYNDAVKHFNQGVQLKNANPSDLQGALSEFEQAAAIDPSKHAAFIELSHKANALVAQTQNQIGADLFNHSKKDEAKPHFEAAAAAIGKAIDIAAKDTSPTNNAQLVTYYSVQASNAKILIDNYQQANLVDDEVKNLDKVEALDDKNKLKWELMKGDLYRVSSKYDEAVASYKSVLSADASNADALYSIGLALVATGDKAKFQEAANYWGEFVSKAPNDKRVPEVKAVLEALKTESKVEPEKPASKKKGKP